MEIWTGRDIEENADNITSREDDVSWPKKNIVGRQELEVRVDKEHISFEVSQLEDFSLNLVS